MKYIIVAYKEDSTDTVLGCEMARYSSDQQIFNSDDLEYITTQVAQLLAVPTAKYGECEYTITAIQSGEIVIEEDSSNNSDGDILKEIINTKKFGFIEQREKLLKELELKISKREAEEIRQRDLLLIKYPITNH